MQIKEHTNVLDGKTSHTKTFSAIEGLTLLPRLMAILPPSTADILFGVSDGDRETIEAAPATLQVMAMGIARWASDIAGGLGVVQDLFRHTKCDQVLVGDAAVTESLGGERFGTHFAADYVHLFRVAWWVARVSFKSP
jgi:hypothetical protein